MEVGCSRIWGLVPTTQTQVGGTPHKPALPAPQPWALPATPDPKSSTRQSEQWVQWKNYNGGALTPLSRERRAGKYLKAPERQHTERWAKQSHEDIWRCMHIMQKNHWPLELQEDATEKPHMQVRHAHAKNRCRHTPKILINANANANATQRNAMPHQTNYMYATCS